MEHYIFMSSDIFWNLCKVGWLFKMLKDTYVKRFTNKRKCLPHTVNPRFSPRRLLSILKFDMGAYSRGEAYSREGAYWKCLYLTWGLIQNRVIFACYTYSRVGNIHWLQWMLSVNRSIDLIMCIIFHFPFVKICLTLKI